MLSLEAPVLSQLDVSDCVRLEPWDLSADGGTFPDVQVLEAAASTDGTAATVAKCCRVLSVTIWLAVV